MKQEVSNEAAEKRKLVRERAKLKNTLRLAQEQLVKANREYEKALRRHKKAHDLAVPRLYEISLALGGKP